MSRVSLVLAILVSGMLLAACSDDELEQRVQVLEESSRLSELPDFTVVGKEISVTALAIDNSRSATSRSVYRVEFVLAGSVQSVDYTSGWFACYVGAQLGELLPETVGEEDLSCR